MEINTTYFVLIFAFIVIIFFYSTYVSLIKKKNILKEAASGIDVQLKKRYDLIPNMLKTAAKFMEHEKELFVQVAKMREAAMSAANYNDKFKAEKQLSEAMYAFNVRAENYPELKSDTAMLQAQQAIAETEEHIAATRRFYNSAVRDYKNALEIFPSSLVASIIGLKDEYPFFEASEHEKASIDVNDYFK